MNACGQSTHQLKAGRRIVIGASARLRLGGRREAKLFWVKALFDGTKDLVTYVDLPKDPPGSGVAGRTCRRLSKRLFCPVRPQNGSKDTDS